MDVATNNSPPETITQFLLKLLAWFVIATILSAFVPGCASNAHQITLGASAVHSDGPDCYAAKIELTN